MIAKNTINETRLVLSSSYYVVTPIHTTQIIDVGNEIDIHCTCHCFSWLELLSVSSSLLFLL